MYRIHPTTLTTRSLDLLARDLASLNAGLRQRRAHAFFLRCGQHSSRRLFHAGSTEPLRTHVEAKELGERRWRDEGSGLRITGYSDAEGVKVGDEIAGLELEEGDGKWKEDGWHAEVEVRAPVEIGGENGTDVDSLGMGTAAAAGVLATGAAMTGRPAAVGGSKSRAESRLERRQRREMAGNYKPGSTASANSIGEEGDNGRDSVLFMIEKMDGPKLPKKKEKIEKLNPTKEEKEAARTAKAKDSKDTKTKDTKSKDKNGEKLMEPTAPKPKRETWQVQKSAHLSKFGDAVWQPRKRLSPDTLEGIRALHASDPATYSTETLSTQFQVSAENIRRILKSKWRPNEEERREREQRWERRGVRKWTEMAEAGERPPRRWREMGVGSVKGQPERKPGWKKGGKRSDQQEEPGDGEWEDDDLGERIL